ncbi:MAG TPA: complex I subunit 5 family protein [Acidisarcina sp.]
MSISAPLPQHLANAVPALPIVLPLLTATVLAVLRKHLPRPVIDAIGIGASLLNLVVCSLLLYEANTQTVVYWFGNWYPRGSIVLGITFVIDPVSAGLACLAATLTTLALLFSWRFVDAGSNHFQPLMLVFLAGMTGFCLTGDLFNLFVFFELMSTAAFALCGLKTREPAPLQGAFNFAVTNTIAAFMVLTGIAFLYSVTGALNMAQIGLLLAHRHDPLVLFACALITCGFLTKAAIVPFHFWLADAHAVSPTPVCVLFSGIMVELGLYAVLRLYTVIFLPAMDTKSTSLRTILLVFGTVTALYGGAMCYAEHHIKRLLAFSTISHCGLMLTAIALQGPLAAAGFLTYLLAHALDKAALFLVAGILLHRLRTASEPALFNQGKKLGFTATLWLLGALGLAGFPGFGTSLGEALTSNAAEAANIRWLSIVFLISGTLTAAAVLRVGFRTFLGWGTKPISDRAAQIDELPETQDGDDTTFWYHIVPPILCIAGAIAVALLPGVREHILNAANRLSNQPAYLHTVYTGETQPLPSLANLDLSARSAAFRGVIAALLAAALALTSVFRSRIPRILRIGAYLEGPLLALRSIQSGHVGDYVLWMTVGIATIGTTFVVMLR